jgi:type I restriction enzyme S subunit
MTFWPTQKLASLCREITVGYVSKMSDQYVPTGIPFLRSQDIEPGRIRTDALKFIPQSFHDRLKKSKLCPGDVVIVRTGYPGTAAVVPPSLPDVNCADLVIVRPSPGLNARFLAFVLNSPWGKGQVRGRLVGVAQQHFNVKVAQALEVPVPPLPVQDRIASILGAYDDLIEVNRRRIALLEEMARRLFEEWFVRFRFPEHEGLVTIDTPDGVVPEGWSRVPLMEVCERITDGSHHSPPSVPVGRMMASVKDMCDWDFDLSACRRISDEDFNELVRNDCRPKIGDILIAKDGANLNKHTFLMWRDVPIVLLSSIAIVRPRAAFEREYLVALLRSPATSNAIKLMKSGAAIPRIVLRDFKRLPIILPPSELRQRFEAVVAPIHDLIRRTSAANVTLAASRDLLLPRLISGELSVSAAERELENAA